MSKLLENKQILHVAAEVVVVLGLVFYFNQKTKQLLGHIEDLSQQYIDQEQVIQKHEDTIIKLVDAVNNLVQMQQNMQQNMSQNTQQVRVKKQPVQLPLPSQAPVDVRVIQKVKGKKNIVDEICQAVKVQEIVDVEEDVDDDVDEDDDISDTEISLELSKLNKIESDDCLKKE